MSDRYTLEGQERLRALCGLLAGARKDWMRIMEVDACRHTDAALDLLRTLQRMLEHAIALQVAKDLGVDSQDQHAR